MIGEINSEQPMLPEKLNAIEIKILNFLSDHKRRRYHIAILTTELNNTGFKVSYPTVLKRTDILVAKGLIKSERFGTVKVVWFE